MADLFAPPGSWRQDAQFRSLWQTAAQVDGWLSEGQARALYRAASLVPDGRWVVEIGSHHGRSTVLLANAKAPGVKMLAVDPFDDPRWGGGPEALAAFQHTLETFGLRGAVEAHRGLSSEAAATWSGDPVGLLFVDGAHDRPSVLTDIDGWEDKIAPGGLVLFHDAFSAVGTTEALTLRHLLSRRFRFLGRERTLVAFVRRELGFLDAVASGTALASGYPYFARNLAIKALLRRGHTSVARSALRYREEDDLY